MSIPPRQSILFNGQIITWNDFLRMSNDVRQPHEQRVKGATEAHRADQKALDEIRTLFFKPAPVDDFRRGDLVTWGNRSDRFVVISGDPQPPGNFAERQRSLLYAVAKVRDWFRKDVEGRVVITNGTHYYRVMPDVLTKFGSLIKRDTGDHTEAPEKCGASNPTDWPKDSVPQAPHARYRV